MQGVILRFDSKSGELSMVIGNEEIIVDGFIRDSTGIIHLKVLSSYAQERIIKKLVSNMELKEVL